MFDRSLSLIEEALKNKYFPSAALAIGAGDKVLLKKVWGDTCIENPKEKITPDTLYDMASVSKVIGASMVAFQLIQNGKLCLDDTVEKFFEAPEDKHGITILNLMTHTSGIAAHFFLSDYTDDPADAAKVILNHPLAAKTGSQTIYSCMGFILLGKILEKIENSTLDTLAQKYVFVPLGMTHTTYHPQSAAACTEFNPSTQKYLCGTVHDENARFLNGVSGNAGVFSTLDDMVHFSSMLACSGLHNGKIYLSRPMLAAAVHNYTAGLSDNRGLGFDLMDDHSFLGSLFSPGAFGHNGFTGTSIAIDPESQLFVVLLTNRVHPTRENNNIVRFRRLFHNSVATEYSNFMQ